MRVHFKRCIALLLCAVCLNTQANDEFEPLLQEIWQFELQVDPVKATALNFRDYDDRLKDVSATRLAKQQQQYQLFQERLLALDYDSLTRSEQITYTIQLRQLNDALDKYRYKAHLMPITSESGFHTKLAMLVNAHRFRNSDDIDNYLARLSQFDTYFQQQINWMKQGLQAGISQPQVVLQGYVDSIAAFISPTPEQNHYYSPFLQLDNLGLTDAQAQEYRNRAKALIQSQVNPAYQGFYDFMSQQYIPNAKLNIASATDDISRAYYQNRIEYYTTTNLSADEIHNIGLKEVARIRQEMQQVLQQLNYQGDLKSFIHFLRTDPQFYATSADQLLKQAAYLSKKIDAKLPQLFSVLPRTPYGVAPVPDNIAPKYTTGRYIAPTNDTQPGYYWVNTYALDKRPLYALTALTLHEAVPGHHLQISLSREMEKLPPVRRFTYISAFGEGWGLYSEYLGKEVGMYETPYDEFGRLSYEMWRATRLVVDTGMHSKNWSRKQAQQYMLDNTALSEHNIKTEIDRYISWPAQALSYKLGEIKIKALRQQAEAALGTDFDIRKFHNAVLEHGSVPLSILQENIAAFIQQKR